MIGALPEALVEWLAGHTPAGRIAHVTELTGGHRNQNLLLTTHRGDHFVLRRYRHGNPCPVEHALTRRLTGVAPVAEVVAADPDGALAGEPVLLSRHLPGATLDRILPDLRGAAAADLGRQVGDALAAIGTVRFRRPGFFTDATLTPHPDAQAADLAGFTAGRADRITGLDAREKAALVALAERGQPAVDAAGDTARLVHSDFNGKNILISPAGTVAAVLDWEFAFAGHPLVDVGNLLRHPDELPADFTPAFLAAFAAGGGPLPPDWRDISAALDLFALVDLLTRPDTHPLHGKITRRVRALLAQHG